MKPIMPHKHSKKRLVVTRPKPAAEPILSLLQQQYGDKLPVVLHLPMQVISGIDFPVPTQIDAVIFTSANGVLHSAKANIKRSIPVFAVGQATAKAAQQAGFFNITVGPSTAKELVPLILQQCEALSLHTIIHFSGQHIAFDLVAALQHQQLDAKRVICYQAMAKPNSFANYQPLSGDIVLFHSAKALEAFENQVHDTGNDCLLAEMICVTLSERIAQASGANWERVYWAEQPTEEALVSLVQHVIMPNNYSQIESGNNGD